MTSLRKEDIRVDIERRGVFPNLTCHVRLTHIPTGLVYECGHHRSEIRNKSVALVGLDLLVKKSGWVPHNDGQEAP